MNSDFVQRCKADLEKERLKLDPFKVENFEPIWNAKPLRSRANYDEILARQRQSKLNERKARREESRLQNELNEKLTSLNSSSQMKAKTVRKRTPKPKNRQTPNQISTASVQTTPIKESVNNSSRTVNTSPLSIGSITVRKSINSSPPVSSNDQSPTNGKLFYISSNGKLLQIQQANDANQLLNERKRKINLEDSNANVVMLNSMNDLKSYIVQGVPNAHQTTHNTVLDAVNSTIHNVIHSNLHQDTGNLNNFLSSSQRGCQQKALVNCSRCQAFCHEDCVSRSNVCDNCQANSNLVV